MINQIVRSIYFYFVPFDNFLEILYVYDINEKKKKKISYYINLVLHNSHCRPSKLSYFFYRKGVVSASVIISVKALKSLIFRKSLRL